MLSSFISLSHKVLFIYKIVYIYIVFICVPVVFVYENYSVSIFILLAFLYIFYVIVYCPTNFEISSFELFLVIKPNIFSSLSL